LQFGAGVADIDQGARVRAYDPVGMAQAKTILPNHYTGFVAATHDSYRMIEDAGILVGRLKKK
jgi:phosphonate transport system substrate-binding protein